MSKVPAFFLSVHPQNSATALPSITDFLRGDRIGAFSSAHDLDALLAAVDTHQAELSKLLKLDFKEFWKSVAGASSLHKFLDSYMRFHNRLFYLCSEELNRMDRQGHTTLRDLDAQVSEFFHRILSNKDTKHEDGDCLDPEEHKALLLETKWLDLPKLMDISNTFGGESMRKLIFKVIRSEPSILDDIGIGLSYFLDITNAFCNRCVESSEVLTSPSRSNVVKRDQIITELLEMRFVVEYGVSVLDYFINAYKPAAIYLSCSTKLSKQEELITSLGRMHDIFDPLLSCQTKKFPLNMHKILHTTWQLDNISNGILGLVRNILVTCYLTDHAFKESSDTQSIKKLFPAMVDDPVIRGNIVFETLVRINEELHPPIHNIRGPLTFLQSLEQRCCLLSRIRMLCEKGWMFLDDEKSKSMTKMMVPPSTKHGFSDQKDGASWRQRFRKMKGNTNFKGWKRGCMHGVL